MRAAPPPMYPAQANPKIPVIFGATSLDGPEYPRRRALLADTGRSILPDGGGKEDRNDVRLGRHPPKTGAARREDST